MIQRMIEGRAAFVNNYLNFSIDNFAVGERGSLRDVVEHENANHNIDDGNNNYTNAEL